MPRKITAVGLTEGPPFADRPKGPNAGLRNTPTVDTVACSAATLGSRRLKAEVMVTSGPSIKRGVLERVAVNSPNNPVWPSI